MPTLWRKRAEIQPLRPSIQSLPFHQTIQCKSIRWRTLAPAKINYHHRTLKNFHIIYFMNSKYCALNAFIQYSTASIPFLPADFIQISSLKLSLSRSLTQLIFSTTFFVRFGCIWFSFFLFTQNLLISPDPVKYSMIMVKWEFKMYIKTPSHFIY